MTTPACPSYAGYRFPAEIISHAVWLYFRFPLSLRMVDELLAACGVVFSHETVRQWALKFGQAFANQIRRRLTASDDKWHLDEVVLTIARVRHWLWRAVDQSGTVNRPGFPGGHLGWVTRPRLAPWFARSGALLPQQGACFRSARAGVGC